MGIQSFFLGSASGMRITAQTAVVSVVNQESGSAFIGFLTNGEQVNIDSGNVYTIGYWVTPATSANEWEIRATLDSGATPIGTLGTWQNFSLNRQWGFSRTTPGFLSCTLTFEFRKVGGTTAEYTISGNSISVEVESPF